MRAWILVLAVLATFQAIVPVASTDSVAMGGLQQNAQSVESQQPQHHHKSKHGRRQHRAAYYSPTLSFAAIVAAPLKGEFNLTNLNNVILNSDNVKYPSSSSQQQQEVTEEVVVESSSSSIAGQKTQQQLQLLVPTTQASAAVSSSSANSVVNTSENSSSFSWSSQQDSVELRSNSNNVNSDNSNSIKSGNGIRAHKRTTHRRRAVTKELRRRRRQQQHHQRRMMKKNRTVASETNSVHQLVDKAHQKEQQQKEEDVRRSSRNELRVESVPAKATEEEEVEEEDEEERQQERVKPDPETLVTIEKNLLSLFGFKKRPKIDRSKVVIPEAMRRMYAETTGMELDLPEDAPKPAVRSHHAANTVRSFAHEESKIDHRFVHHHRFRLHFNTTNIPPEEILKAAELVLSRDAVPDADRIRHRVQVYDIVRPGIKGKREPSFLLIDTKVVKVNTTENLILDVTPAMERWQREPKHNHGLLVHVSTVGRRGGKRVARSPVVSEDSGNSTSTTTPGTPLAPEEIDGPMHHHVRLRRSVRDTEEQWAQKQPLLFTYTDDKRHRTSRAAKDSNGGGSGNGGGGKARARNRTKKKPRGICQRHALWVDFEDVGWNDWIVAPRGYDAFYCKGECRIPMADHLNSTNHAVVQTLVNSLNGQWAPRACCVPTQLTTISLLYLDDQNKLVLKKYQDMAVVGCGCR